MRFALVLLLAAGCKGAEGRYFCIAYEDTPPDNQCAATREVCDVWIPGYEAEMRKRGDMRKARCVEIQTTSYRIVWGKRGVENEAHATYYVDKAACERGEAVERDAGWRIFNPCEPARVR